MNRRSFLIYLRQMSLSALLVSFAVLLFSSCGGSKKTSKIRKIERHSRRNPDPTGATLHREQGRKVRAALRKEEKRKEELHKQRQKEVKRGINRRHLRNQDKETRRRMNRSSREAERRRRS